MKKTISLCIAFILLLSVPFPCTLAENTEEITPKKSFELIEALGIDEGINTDGEALITRAEFVAMAVRCLNESGIDMYDGSFTDVEENAVFANEIYAAKALRMTSGTAEGIFSPDAAVTMPVALKIMMTAMGYEGVAQAKGGYPSGYMALESTLRLLKGLKIEGELTVNDAKTIMTNALKADAAVFTGVEQDMIIYDRAEGKNLLTEKFRLKEIEGVVTTADYLTVEADIPDENHITVAGRSFKCRVPSSQYFGMTVTAWYSTENDEVYAIEKGKLNEEITVYAKDVTDYSNNTLTVSTDNKVAKYRTQSLSFMRNGRLIDHSSADFKFNDGTLRLIDNDSDGLYEFVMAEKIEYFVISGINEVTKAIYDKNSPVGGICFENTEEDEDKHNFLLDSEGESYPFEKLAENDVVCVMMSDDKKVCVVRAGGSKSLSGVFSAQSDDAIEIAGAEYETNDYFTARKIVLTLGEEYDFLLAPDGSVTTAVSLGSAGIKYGYLLGFGRSGGISGKTEMKILNEKGEIEILPLAKKLMLDGEKNVKRTDAKIDTAFQNGQYPKYQVFRYNTNDAGEISLIDTALSTVNTTWQLPEGVDERNRMTQYLSQSSLEFRDGASFGIPYISFKKAVVFGVPMELADTPDAEYDEKLFTVLNVSSLEDGIDFKADAFDFDENYYPQAITAYTEKAAAGADDVSVKAECHIVYQVRNAIDAEGNDTVLIRTYSRGLYDKFYVHPDKLAGIRTAGNIPEPGDVIRMSTDRSGYITAMAIDVNYNESSSESEIIYTAGAARSDLSYISGSVMTIGDNAVTLKATVAPAALINNIAPLPLSSTQYIIYNTTENTVTKGVITDVVGEKSAGSIANASKVICRLKSYMVRDMFIYVN